jgi:hypothetical protein
VEPAEPKPINNPPIAFKTTEFALGLFIAAGIVFTVAGTRWYVRARTTTSTDICRANVQQLKGAKESWARAYHMTGDDIPAWTNLVGAKGYFTQPPVCPGGGTYNLNSVAQPARCSIPYHLAP